ncbi:MAG: hypothetical protein JNM18_20685 [Planctomycetaceae bacterium]|nr:hypothetical protein [Planctomycetaceae bacterium]
MKTNLLLLLAWIVLAHGSAWAAEDASPQPAVETRELVLWPAREPAVGTFELSYAPDELRAGNAAIDLYKAILLAQNLKLDSEQLDPQRLNADERQAKLAAAKDVFRYLRYAARCRHCDWQVPWNEEPPFEILLPELQQIRALQRLLMLQCHQQIVSGRLAAATATLREGYALARHTASGPTLIHGLVGVAMGVLANDQLELLLQQRDCPSLLWPVVSLSRPFVDLRPALRFEETAVELQFPQLRRLREETLDEQTAVRLVTEMLNQMAPLLAIENNAPQNTIDTMALLAKLMVFAEAPAAKKRLHEAGIVVPRLDKMPLPQLAVVDAQQRYHQQYAALRRWFDLPLAEALRRETELKQGWEQPEIKRVFPLFQLVMPAVTSARKSTARVDRQLAALATIDAVRRYAAAHDGQLPAKLDDLPDGAWLRDPFTGEPFPYIVKDDHAVLTVPLVGDTSASSQLARQYVLRRGK